MVAPSLASPRRFAWSALQGPCRRRLPAGLLLLVLAANFTAYAAFEFSARGRDALGFDQPLVRLARTLTPQPRHLSSLQPQNTRELYLVTVVTDQQDMLFGLTLLALRMIVVMTIGGFGLVLLTAGATEWEIRSGTPR
jgi:hypothetical protein